MRAALDGLRDAPQHLVAPLMAVVVVIGLEVIDIGEDERQYLVAARGAQPFLIKVFVEAAAIGYAGEAVEARQALQFFILFFEFDLQGARRPGGGGARPL